jgi:hypothetical protein
MAQFMDVHEGFFGITGEQLAEAHARDLEIASEEDMVFHQTWLDDESGKVFCLTSGPSKEALMRVHERAGHPVSEAQVFEISAVV